MHLDIRRGMYVRCDKAVLKEWMPKARSQVTGCSTEVRVRRVDTRVGRLCTTPVYESYWHFAAQRQGILYQRLSGMQPPWTEDPILQRYRFTNAYRAADRVSQYLIRHVIYDRERSVEDTVFRILLFKIFNRIETWESLEQCFGPPCLESFDLIEFGRFLSRLRESGQPIYSAAYMMPSPGAAYGYTRKHENHLALLVNMMRDDLPKRLQDCASLREVFEALNQYPSIGQFLAYQYAIDLNYSSVIDFSEMSFVVAGPGAIDGIAKCFGNRGGMTESEIIAWVAERQDSEFARLGCDFRGLGNRPLQLIDCQNLFCEIGKYARVAHPEYAGRSGRTRIKQRYVADDRPVDLWFPPKWGINEYFTQRLATR